MTNNRLQTSTTRCYRVDWLDLENEIPKKMHVADVTDGIPVWRIAQLVQERIDDDGLVIGVRDKGDGVVIMHNQVETGASHTSLGIEEAYFYRIELQEPKQRFPTVTYVANASDDAPLWRIAEVFQSRIEEHSFVVAIDEVSSGLAILPRQDAES